MAKMPGMKRILLAGYRSEYSGPMHRVVALALPDVVAFDLAIPAQVFGHEDERGRYSFRVCAAEPGLVPTTSGYSIQAPDGLDALLSADTVVVPGYEPLDESAQLRGQGAADRSKPCLRPVAVVVRLDIHG